LQIAATAPADIDALLGQRFVKDESRGFADILKDASAKYHERITALDLYVGPLKTRDALKARQRHVLPL
jgi:hypothetical protein